LKRLAIFDPDPIPKLELSRQAADSDDHLLQALGENGAPVGKGPSQRWLALHPGSGSERQNWPEDKWAVLVAHLATSTDLKFVLVGGAAEGDRLQRLSRSLATGRFQIAQRLPLSDLGRVLGQCRAYIGHDSGISHLAAAVGLKGLILWGDS